MKANRDEFLEEIWEIRRQIAQRLGHDPKKRTALYQRKQKQLGAKLYRRADAERTRRFTGAAG